MWRPACVRRGPITCGVIGTVIVASVGLVSAGVAQGPGAGLAVPVPPESDVRVVADSFMSSTGARRQYDVYRAAAARGTPPVVIFVNGSGPALRSAASYVEWARLVTARGLAGVLYEGPTIQAGTSLADILRASVADLDSVVSTLGRRSGTLEIDASRVVIWAGSGQTTTGTPYALESGRESVVRGYVLYYGAGAVHTPRTDVPVFVGRAGLDVPALNRSLDSLTQQLTNAGVPLTVVNYPAGQHGFDLYDNSEMTARVIAQTLDFMVAVTTPGLQQSIVAGVSDVRAAAAFTARRWSDAERLYGELVRARPDSRFAVWRLGLAQLENGKPDGALASFDRARELGQGGARDIGLPATRAALRAGQTARAVEWLQWALRSFPRIRAEVEADAELAPLLQHPLLRGGADLLADSPGAAAPPRTRSHRTRRSARAAERQSPNAPMRISG